MKPSPLSSWIREVGFSGCRIKSGMTKNFGLLSYILLSVFRHYDNGFTQLSLKLKALQKTELTSDYF
jgi:hypothetical protein